MPEPIPFEVKKVAEADFPTEYGHFRIHGFEGRRGEKREEAVVIVMGDVTTPEPVLVRIHSQCLTGDVFHSLRCDCRAQLELAMETVAGEGRGMVIYEKKEGRGIGLLNKLRAYELQDGGADTIEANEQLGFEADLRVYQLPGAILRHFGVQAVRLMTNNPEKIAALEAGEIVVTERVPCNAVRGGHSARYLKTKKKRMGHLLEL
ncbi:MAG TPA: GTP cyclohydrolase II [Paludibaculum sp.]|jgi:GTP cyclohydrolase II